MYDLVQTHHPRRRPSRRSLPDRSAVAGTIPVSMLRSRPRPRAAHFYSSIPLRCSGRATAALGCSVLRVNTRGHDLMSTASTSVEGLRWELPTRLWKRLPAPTSPPGSTGSLQRAGPRVGCSGHSPARSSACTRGAGAQSCGLGPWSRFRRRGYRTRGSAQRPSAGVPRHVRASATTGQHRRAEHLLDVRLPLPFVVTAAAT